MEYLDVVDEQGNPTGESVSRAKAHEEGIRHRTAHVWIVRKSPSGYQILMQKRSRCKESFPGLYDTSSAGHIPAGTEPVPSALRELEEELGIRATAADLRYAGTFRIRYERVFHRDLYKDNEVTSVYVYTGPVDIEKLVLQQSEVEEVRWFDLEGVWKEIEVSRERFCAPAEGLKILRNFLDEQSHNQFKKNLQRQYSP